MRSLLDLQPEKELQLTHHTHLELPRHLLRKLGDKSVRRDTKDDEHMAGQINSGSNSLDENNDSIVSSSNNLKDRCFTKFGAFSVDVKQMLKAGNIDSIVTLPAKLIFQGDNFLKKIEATKQRRFIKSGYVSSRENIEKPRKYIFIGLMQVEIIEETPS